MNIGEFKQSNGRLMGSIATRTIDLPRLGLRPVESSNDRAPVFEIVALNVGNRWVQVGEHTTGEVFYQGTIDDPSLAEPLPVALFGNNEDGYRVAWRRPQRRDDFGTAVRNGRSDEAPAGQGGFGESTAGFDGSLAGAGAGLEDDVPY
jgi:uncharacterized protein (DUF736 family)